MLSPQTWMEVGQLHANFAWGIDRNDPDLAAAQFVADGTFILPAGGGADAAVQVYEGREAIAGRWRGRAAVTRHAFLNLQLNQVDADLIEGKILCLGFRHDGAGIGDSTPIAVTDFADRIVRDVDGCWRFAERRASVVFLRAAT